LEAHLGLEMNNTIKHGAVFVPQENARCLIEIGMLESSSIPISIESDA